MPKVELDGLPVIDADESEEITVAVSADDMQTGNPKNPENNITLKRGVIRGDIFRLWSSAPEKGRPILGTLKVIAHDIQQWTFTNVFPNKFKGPDLKGEANDISVETIEITAEGVAVQKECDH